MTRPQASISNIAWPAEHDPEALDLVAALGFSGVELAPAKVFGPLADASRTHIARYRETLERRGLKVSALQAILFGVTDVHLFRSEAERDGLAERLAGVAQIAGELGATACVFGSPALRDPGVLSTTEALNIATDFFGALALVFEQHGTVLAFEANPSIYDCRFVTRTIDAIDLVRRVDTAGFGLQLDLGTVFANDEDDETLQSAAAMAVHCHASEPHLAALGTGGYDHRRTAAILRESGYNRWVSVEMRSVNEWRSAIHNAGFLLAETYTARL